MILFGFLLGMICGATSRLLPKISGAIVATIPVACWVAYVCVLGPKASDAMVGGSLLGALMGLVVGGAVIAMGSVSRRKRAEFDHKSE